MKVRFNIYEDLAKLVDDHTFTKILQFTDYETIFICFFSFNCLVLLAFLIHHLINFLIKNLIMMKSYFSLFKHFCATLLLRLKKKIFKKEE